MELKYILVVALSLTPILHRHACWDLLHLKPSMKKVIKKAPHTFTKGLLKKLLTYWS